jgi:hypothetical protein
VSQYISDILAISEVVRMVDNDTNATEREQYLVRRIIELQDKVSFFKEGIETIGMTARELWKEADNER